MKRCVRALIISSATVIGVAAFNGMQTRDARADRAQPDISDCMSFRNEVKQRSIVMRAKNECDRKLSCVEITGDVERGRRRRRLETHQSERDRPPCDAAA